MQQANEKLEADRRLLAEAHSRGRGATTLAYLKLSGPGWLQSAITLGGGSLASSLYLGVLAGFSLLWLQPVAMILGIIMLSAIGYVALSTTESPFRAINRHVNPVLGWGWALASLAANMVWCLPQYSLANGVLQQNLLPGVLGADGLLGNYGGKIVISLTILVVTIAITWSYDRGGWGIRLYEGLLKAMVAIIVLSFIIVVFKLSRDGEVKWSEIFAGFIPNPAAIFTPAPAFAEFLSELSLEEHRGFWRDLILSEQRDVLMSAAATAVGINMTFLFPYTLLRRGWGREFRGLATFDLGTGMFIPFVLATSCVIIASMTQFHGQPQLGLIVDNDAASIPAEQKPSAGQVKQFQNLLERRQVELPLTEVSTEALAAEKKIAAMLVRRDAFDLAKSLKPLMGNVVGNVIFGIGVLGMTLSTITILMLISGFVICEIFGLPQGGWPHRLGTLAAATGVLGPFIWSEAAFWLAVPTSVFGLTLLPIAYLTFFLLMNQKNVLGNDMPRGARRVRWNLLMGGATLVAGVASLWMIWVKSKGWGIALVAAFLGAALVVHFVRRSRANIREH